VGLALRWVAALVEMEPTLAICDDVRDDVTQMWREVCDATDAPTSLAGPSC
jgi:hypothetical protein